MHTAWLHRAVIAFTPRALTAVLLRTHLASLILSPASPYRPWCRCSNRFPSVASSCGSFCVMAASCISLALSSGSLAAVSTRPDCALSKRIAALSAAPSISVSSIDPLSSCRPRLAVTLSFPGQRRGSRCAAFAASSDLEQDLYGENDQQSFAPPPPPEQGSKLYVGNLPWDVDSRTLAEVFQDVGTVEQVEVFGWL